MHKKGFRKGPLGYLLQEPTEEAGLIKDDPSLQDKSAPKKEDLVLLWSVREGVTSLTKEKSLVNTLCFLYNGATCVPGTRMYKLQHYLWSQMQSDRPSQRHQPRLLRKRVPLLKELMFLVPEQSAATQTKRPVSTAADRRTVESSPVCSQIIEDCGKDENLSSSETTSYSVPHRAEASHGAVHLSMSLMKLFFFVYCQAFKMFF
ncbi:uncharacterized protein LOC131368919 isoform X1 [Hemibagrus wyckioides]|uniref:uncharacterized protein LOC131368919 isoform X1 n=1 Tax=Hemibagrus wyckioides TaxID=337641 RepID=UPI00266B458D|nr:uncharacterized protein LOC131368919 isoform X1 [Hemibagrus wyckioides]